MSKVFRRHLGDEDFLDLLDQARRDKQHVRLGLESGETREGRVGPVAVESVTVGGNAVPLADVTWAELVTRGVDRCG